MGKAWTRATANAALQTRCTLRRCLRDLDDRKPGAIQSTAKKCGSCRELIKWLIYAHGLPFKCDALSRSVPGHVLRQLFAEASRDYVRLKSPKRKLEHAQ